MMPDGKASGVSCSLVPYFPGSQFTTCPCVHVCEGVFLGEVHEGAK